ncbi:MAG: sn-glycerol-3-phosphate ABC transporter ATP-binding protein UgpC [Ideonella sp.]|nr:sn-glycerol-3-phosphate ABC transporter ATP-binding protein UgpC [Ideonella sp.]
MASLKLENLAKTYGDVAVVHDINCSIGDGEFIVIVGPSGCGKSTLLRMIAGLESVSSGRIHIDGRDATDIPAAERGIAMVFQSYALYPHMTVRDNMSFALRNLKHGPSEITARVEAAARLLQLETLLDRMPSHLSGGQRQRVAIGRAIVREPKIFLFDEPLSNLDAELRVQMRRELGRLHRRLGSTMVYVTHDQVEAMTLADKIILLDKGGIAQFGTPLEIYNQPCNLFAAGFMGSPKINLVQAEVKSVGEPGLVIASALGPSFALPRQRLGDAPPPRMLTLGLRPECLRLEPREGDVTIKLKAGAVELLGDSSCIYGALANGAEFVLKLQGQIKVADGADLLAHASISDILLFDPQGRLISSTH